MREQRNLIKTMDYSMSFGQNLKIFTWTKKDSIAIGTSIGA